VPNGSSKIGLYSSIWMKSYRKTQSIWFGLIKMQTFTMPRWRHILHEMTVSEWPSTIIGPCGESKIVSHLLHPYFQVHGWGRGTN
jgi:hypothetical protein